jgi:aldose 1-epimerase
LNRFGLIPKTLTEPLTMSNFTYLESSNLGVMLTSRGAGLAQLISKGRNIELLLDASQWAADLIDQFCIGGTVGPYAGRLQHKNGVTGESSVLLHGSNSGLHRLDWRLDHTDHATTVSYSTSLNHGDGGLPGDREFSVRYTLENDRLIIDFAATSNRDTPISVTNHAYFTLGARSVSDLSLQINAHSVLETDSLQCATGALLPVANTRLDFTGQRLLADVQGPLDLDHSYVLDSMAREALAPNHLAVLSNPANGISLSISTTQPCLQVYTASQLAKPLIPYSAICLEAQGFPNGPNHALGHGNSILRASHSVTQRIVYQISETLS